MRTNIVLSVIIVHYQAKQEMFACLKSIAEFSPKVTYEIIVVDNNADRSLENTVKKFKKVKYIRSNKNLGYSKANNLGVKMSKGKYLLFLNPDTKVFKDTLDKLISHLEIHPKTSIVSPLIYDEKKRISPIQGSLELNLPNGIVTLSFINKIFPDNPISRKFFLRDRSYSHPEKVDVVSGSAFMIHRNIFNQIGGFDENFLLYFEESDLCRRVKKQGCEIEISPSSKIIHYGGRSTKDKVFAQKQFNKSRFYYFKKHFGIITALLIELFARFSKETLAFLIIIFTAIFLRFVNLSSRFPFSGEMGDNLLDVKNYILNNEIPLKGPPTSHPWLSFGPYYYWIMIPSMLVFKYNPLVAAYIGGFVGVLIVMANYFVLKKIFGLHVARFSSLMLTLSPLFILFSQDSRFYFFTVLFFYLLLSGLHKYWNGENKQLFKIGLSFGLMLNFHYSSLLVFPAIIFTILYKKKKIIFRELSQLIAGVILAFIPIIIFDLKNKLHMMTQFILWVPYRIAGFLNIVDKNNSSINSLTGSLSIIFEFIGKSFSYKSFWYVISLSLLISIFYLIRNKIIKLTEFPWIFFIGSFLTTVLGIIIHGSVPVHYLLPIFPIPIIILSLVISKILKESWFLLFIAMVLLLLNYKFYSKLIFEKESYVSLNPSFVSYDIQKSVAKEIISNVKDNKFKLERVGPGDYFKDNYAQNYIYLLWLLGNEPVENVSLKYTIYEDTSKLPQTKNNLIWVDNIAILKI